MHQIQVLAVLFSVVGSSAEGTENKTIRIGFLHHEEVPYRAPAITLAIEDFQKRGGLTDFSFEIYSRKVRCSAKDATTSMIDLYLNHHIDVVIGPPCVASCVSASYHASYWNIPMLSHACVAPTADNKVIHNTLIRVLPSIGSIGKAFVDIFREFGWTRAVLMVMKGTYSKPCVYGSQGIQDSFRQNNLTFAEVIIIPIGDLPSEEMDRYLKRAQGRGRVILFCRDNEQEERAVMLRAHALGMTGGEYVFFTYRVFPPVAPPWIMPPNASWQEMEDAVAPFLPYKKITVAGFGLSDVTAFYNRTLERGLALPWKMNPDDVEVDFTGGAQLYMLVHDAVDLYLRIVNETLLEGQAIKGAEFARLSHNQDFVGTSGHVLINENADREPDYWVWQMNPERQELEILAETGRKGLNIRRPVFWNTKNGQAPPDTPTCGFRSELCTDDKFDRNMTIVLGSIGLMVWFVTMGLLLYYKRQKKREHEIQQMLWKVNFVDITLLRGPDSKATFSRSIRGSKTLSHSRLSGMSGTLGDEHSIVDLSLTLGLYKGITVVVRRYMKTSVALTRLDLVELKVMKEFSHENLNPFIGACIDVSNFCSLTLYSPKGTLQDIILNDDIQLDWLFKKSLLFDLANGMSYIHTSQLGSHGRLKSSSCLVDNRWVLKIASYGLSAFRNGDQREQTEYRRQWEMLWTAPEILRLEQLPRNGTKKGDVYSFAIIVQELLYRAQPFFDESSAPKELLGKLRVGSNPPLRPKIPAESRTTATTMVSVMKSCWDETPEARPSFEAIKKYIKHMNHGRRVNIMDNMVKMLEKYANNLEDIVEHRTTALLEEKKKTDTLLYRMMPKTVAEQLKSGKPVDAELFDEVTIYFSDIVGFTSLSSESTPMQIIDFLNDLYTLFDDVIAQHDVYKVETIGDAYMVVSGVPTPNGHHHVAEIVNMAIDLLDGVTKFQLRHRPGHVVKLRVGIHTGPCAAGVVGLTMPRYCLFGDTVNTASRMESTGEANKIHLSQPAKSALNYHAGYLTCKRGQIEVKGKGLQTTYWLVGKMN